MRVALAQMNSTVGDIGGNAARIREKIEAARDEGAALVVLPELVLTGYPPEDLLLKRNFLERASAALESIAESAQGIVAVVGFPELDKDVYNAAAVLADGRVAGVYRKNYLPNYGVFDERRYFQSSRDAALIEVNGVLIGITICEDIWEPGPPLTAEALAGAHLIVNLSASPYHAGKGAEREQMLVQRARDSIVAIAFCNMVGGQDELVFDGYSLGIDGDGEVIARAPQFEESMCTFTFDPSAVETGRLRDTRNRAAAQRSWEEGSAEPTVLARLEVSGSDTEHDVGGPVAPPLSQEEEIYRALVTGVRDYVEKNGFSEVVFGLSGGIDSALVALVAADALGPDRVNAVIMPSPYSSDETQADARTIAQNVGAEVFELPIEQPMQAFDSMLSDVFAGREPDITEENLQARIRGNLVMALSNKFGWLVLTTGNKSELSVGYATLYGDMAGGFAVLKDVFKHTVYDLVRWRNANEGRELVPATVLERPPSAELRYEQRDSDSLPPYDVLDGILKGYIEEELDAEELERRGLPGDEVERVIRMVDRAEYKRRQAPPGIRISVKAFGRDRRLPITNRFEAGSRAAAEPRS
ncbi:MAG TPA: NAD+ synthase [Thermoleophilaceae bacterium]